MKQCPNGHSVDDNAKFCPQCGAEIVGAVYCTKCGKELEGMVKFCPQCGTPIGGIPISSDNEIDSYDVNESPTNKYKKWGIIAAIAATVVLLGGVAWYFLVNQKDHFSKELTLVKNDEGKYGFNDQSGSEVIPCIYEEIINPSSKEIGCFYNGIAIVKREGLYGLLDEQGVERVPCRYHRIIHYEDGYAIVEKQEGEMGVMDITGREVIPCEYSFVCPFSEGYALVMNCYDISLTGEWNKVMFPGFGPYKKFCGFVDTNGKETIPLEYEDAHDFRNGIALVKKDGWWGSIDKNGRTVENFEYNSPEDVPH